MVNSRAYCSWLGRGNVEDNHL